MDDIRQIRSYCLSLTDPHKLEDLAQRLELLQFNRPPLPVSRTAQGLAAAAVSLARGGERDGVLAAIDQNAHPEAYARIEAGLASFDDEYSAPPGWEERVWEERKRQERSFWARLRRLFRL